MGGIGLGGLGLGVGTGGSAGRPFAFRRMAQSAMSMLLLMGN
jgi:hypothetical protein